MNTEHHANVTRASYRPDSERLCLRENVPRLGPSGSGVVKFGILDRELFGSMASPMARPALALAVQSPTALSGRLQAEPGRE
jgi:hypothetical protein